MSAYFWPFGILLDRYYWQTAVLIARNGLARQYRNSFLGHIWTVLQPLTMVLAYGAIMPMIVRQPPSSNYVLYIVVSVPVWNFFSSTLVNASGSVIGNAHTLKRCTISSTLFPVADVLQIAYRFAVAFAVIYSVTVLLGISQPHITVLLLPLYFIPVLLVIGSLSIAIAFVAPYVRDVGELVSTLMMVSFWLTPVVYEMSVLPPRAQEWLRWNPFFIMLRPIQMLAYEHTVPGAGEIARLAALTAVAALTGFAVFRRCRRNYVYYL